MVCTRISPLPLVTSVISTCLEYKCLFDASTSKDITVSYQMIIKIPVTNHKPSILVIVHGGSLDYLAFVLSLVLE
jgi:hypothetical protein